MPKPILIALSLVFAAALPVTGCGGSDEATSGGGDTALAKSNDGPLTKVEFIKQADAICRKAGNATYHEARKYRTEHQEELKKLEPVPREEKLIRAVVLPSILEQVKDIEALDAPEGEEKKIKTMLLELKKGVKKAEKNPYAIELEVPEENPLRKAIYMLRAYGFNACRSPA